MSHTDPSSPRDSEYAQRTQCFDDVVRAAENKRSLRWRVIDIVVAAVLAVACGLLFWLWNTVGGTAYTTLNALTPGFGGLPAGVWLLGGVLGGLIIRKPGAAIFVELIAAILSTALGSQWGVETLYYGFAQGLGAELIFLVFAYRRFSVGVAMLAGLSAAVLSWATELVVAGNAAMGWSYNLIYLACMAASGAVIAGLLGWLLVRALAATGALDRFAVGRERQAVV